VNSFLTKGADDMAEQLPPKKLFVRFADKNDEQKIFDFYAANEHAFVFAREPDVWRERIASGAVTLIEDAQGHIVAAAISYPVVVKNDKGEDEHRWTELGSVRISLQNLGLFNVLVPAQVMRAFLFETPSDRFVVEIVPENAHSKHVFAKLGGQPFDIPQTLADKINETISPEDKGTPTDWFQLGVENMPLVARMFAGAVDNPVLTDRATGAVYELDFSRCVVATQFMDIVRDIGVQDMGDPAQPHPGKHLRDVRNKIKP
jgi:hypothetical protein